MAQATLAEVLPLFTKVNTKLLERIESLEDAQPKKSPSTVLEKPKPVSVDAFSKKAIDQLSGIGVKTKEKTRAPVKTKKDDDSLLSKLLGLLGLGGLLSNLKGLKDRILDWGKKQIGPLVKTISSNFIKGLKAAWEGLKWAWSGIKKFASWSWDKLKAAGNKLIEKSKAAWEAVKNSRVGKAIGGFFNRVGQGISSLAKNIAQRAKDVAALAAEKLSNVKDAIVNAGKSAFEKFSETSVGKAVTGAASKVGGAISKGYSAAKNFVTGGAAMAKEAGTSVLGAVKSGAKSVVEFGGAAIDKGKQLLSAGKNFLSRFRFGGKLFNNLIKKVPYLGAIIQSFFTKSEIEELIAKHEKDPAKYPLSKLFDDIGEKAAGGLGNLIGSTGGAALGGFLGSFIGPGPGTVIGGILGSMGGGYAGEWLGELLSKAFKPQRAAVGEYLYNKLKGKPDEITDKIGDTSADITDIEDGIITRDGKVVQPHKDDTIYAMKNGGPFEEYFNENNKISKSTNTMLEKLQQTQANLLSMQLKALGDNNKILSEIKFLLTDKKSGNVTVSSTINNSLNGGSALRNLQTHGLQLGSPA